MSEIADLLTELERPLWQGVDDEFAAYMQTTFGIPPTMTHIRITGRGSSGRSAVVIEGREGAIIFAITPQTTLRKTHIRPYVAGGLGPDVVRRAEASSGDDNSRAISALGLRHLSPEAVMDLMAPASSLKRGRGLAGTGLMALLASCAVEASRAILARRCLAVSLAEEALAYG